MASKNLRNLVICFVVVSQTNSETILFFANHPVGMICLNEDFISISKIEVYQPPTKCQRILCSETDKNKIKITIMDKCHGKRWCSISEGISNVCLRHNGYVDLSYLCYDPIFSSDFEVLSRPFKFAYLNGGFWNPWIGFLQRSNNNYVYQWQRKQGSAEKSNRGPQKDHTKTTCCGYYALADASNRVKGNTTSLRSSRIHTTTRPGECLKLSFWYSIQGDRHQTLEVYQDNGQPFWLGPTGNVFKWHHHELMLNPVINSFHLYFKAIRGTGNTGFIAIDDILVLKANCNGSISHTDTCLSMSNPRTSCPIHKIDFRKIRSKFIPEHEECSVTYKNLTADFVDQCESTKDSFCSFNISTTLQKNPKCLMLDRIEVHYTCKASTEEQTTAYVQVETSTVDITAMERNSSNFSGVHAHVISNSTSVNQSSFSDSKDKGNNFVYIIACSIGLAVIVLCFVVWKVYNKRPKERKRNSLLNDSHIRMNDYNDDLNGPLNTNVDNEVVPTLSATSVTCFKDHTYTNIALAGSNVEGEIYINSDQVQIHINDAGLNNRKTKTQKTEIKELTIETKYEILDPIETGYDRSGIRFEENKYINANKTQSSVVGAGIRKHAKNTETTKYEVLDPTETGYDRSGITTEYELASSISRIEPNVEEDVRDLYVLSGDGVYDTSKNIRHVTDDDVNVYNQTLDDVYNTTSYEKKN